MITADREILFERKTVIIGLNAELGMWGTLSLAFRSMWGNWRKKRTQKKREKKICWILSLTFPTTTPLCSIPCKVYAWSIIMLAITIEWSNLSHLFLPSFFHFSGSQEGKSETLLKMCVRTGDNFTFSLFFYDTIRFLCSIPPLNEALINFSACYFGNFSFCCHVAASAFHFAFETLSEWSRDFRCSSSRRKMDEWMCLYSLLIDSEDMGWQRTAQSCVPRTNGLQLPV